jgi:hypothetical protein
MFRAEAEDVEEQHARRVRRRHDSRRVGDVEQVRSIQKFFTHRPVSTFDRIPFQLTDR